MRHLKTILLLGGLTILLAACSTTSQHSSYPTGKGTYKVGNPYKIAGKWYHPKEDPDYDEVGIASWYGPQFHGRHTANGEVFDMNRLSAAHTTLPMPSFVRVTNLSNGRSIILRVNDRGPFAHGRIIDVSRKAAQQLGFEKKGLQKVRVQAVSNPDAPVQLASLPATIQEPVPVELELQAQPTEEIVTEQIGMTEKMTSQPAVSENTSFRTAFFIQAGAFSLPTSAQQLAEKLTHMGPIRTDVAQIQGKTLYRVRIGPVTDRQTADIILGRVLSYGQSTAHIVQDRCDC